MSYFGIISLVFLIATVIGLWKMFEKSGVKGWYAAIPFYNFWVWLQLIKKPWWWYIFILIPFINVFTILLMIVEYLKCFNKTKLWEQGLGTIFPFIYLPYLGFKKEETYTHPDKIVKIKKTMIREWTDAIIFAVIAATIIRTFFIEAYTIPTSSMEKSLLVGDFLFVSKMSYGPRLPMTPLAVPFTHHTIPGLNIKAYVEWISLPFHRFFGFGDVQRNDAVVFNYPDGDTVALNAQDRSYYALVRHYGRDTVCNKKAFGEIVARPIDKRENYIKRCVGIAGDTLQIIDAQVYINHKPLQLADNAQFNYVVQTNGEELNYRFFDKCDITDGLKYKDVYQDYLNDPSLAEKFYKTDSNQYYLCLTRENAIKIKEIGSVKKVTRAIKSKQTWNPDIFPYDTLHKWNEDNFGPIIIPKRGMKINIDMNNISLFVRIIDVYEGNKLEIKNNKIYINNVESNSYTFKMNYYWLMGDNRHNSADSRFWGFVPEDHVVGKAVFVWLSLDKNKKFLNKIRWNRLFSFVKNH